MKTAAGLNNCNWAFKYYWFQEIKNATLMCITSDTYSGNYTKMMFSCTDLTALIARLAISSFTNFKANNKSQVKKGV